MAPELKSFLIVMQVYPGLGVQGTVDRDKEKAEDNGISELILAKQRNGPTGTVRVRFHGGYTRFDNLAPGEYDDASFG